MPREAKGAIHVTGRRPALALAIVAAAALGLGAASQAHAQRQSAIQLTPDSGRYMISKPVGNSRWVITYNLDDKTVTGNVFNTETDDVDFLWCRILTDQVVHQPDPLETSYPLQCFLAAGCTEAPCSASAWTELVGVQPLEGSFLLPPGTKATLAGNVQPVLTEDCGSSTCHGSGAPRVVLADGETAANTVNQPAGQDSSKSFVEPFDDAGSYLLDKVLGTASIGSQMPLGGTPLSAEELDAIRTWILEGAANN